MSGPDRIETMLVRNMLHDPTLAPEGASVIQVLHPANFDFWHDVHHAPMRYRALEQRLAAQVRERLERHLAVATSS